MDTHLGLTPISDAHPAGLDAKATPQYEEMQEQVSGVNSLHGSPTQWDKVAALAADILANSAKDINAAAYLCVALGNTEGLAGWNTGAKILADVLEMWWEDGFPPLKRVRARVNTLGWWHERSRALLQGPFDPIDAALHELLQQNLERIDALCAEKMPDLEPFYDLRQAIASIPVIAPPAPAATPTAPQTDAPSAPASPPPIADAHAAAPEPQTTPPAAPSTAMPPQAVAPSPGASPEEIGQIFLAAARQCRDSFFDQTCPSSPLAWQALSLSLWGGINALPQAENSVTMIPPPDGDRLGAVNALLKAGKHAQTVRAAVLLAPECPLCFDVVRLLDKALQGAGEEFRGAQTIIRNGLRGLLDRFPTLATLAFADGRPFADAATQQWLATIGRAEDSSATNEQIGKLLAEASRLCAEGDVAKALDTLQHTLERTRGADAVRLRVAQIHCAVNHGQWSVACALSAQLDAVLDKHDLDAWDARLCIDARTAMHRAWSGHGEAPSLILAEKQAARIAVLRPAAALTLVMPNI